jgi:hypothetical protein
VEFQDELNEYQQDSFSLVDPDDVARAGQEVSATLSAMGLPNYDQAARLLKLNLDKSVRGNSYIEFDTSVKAFGVRPGDLVTVTYLKEGLIRQPFRVLKIAPGVNHRITRITAQVHNDLWYADSNGQTNSAPGGRRQGDAGVGVPKPLLGSVADADGIHFGVEETATTSSDGSVEISLVASFIPPATSAEPGPGIPLISLAAEVSAGGTLTGGQTLYYTVTGRDGAGNEGLPSFVVRAVIVSDGSKVKLQGLRFAPGTTAFHVYRGSTPAAMMRVASDQEPAAEFSDGGLAEQLVPLPDSNYDHANFYWRMELQPEVQVTVHSATSVGNDGLNMTANRYRGMVARITKGRGAGQERTIAANTGTVVTVAPAWVVEPDATSWFTVAEGSWKFGSLTKGSPAQFAVPNHSGETVQIIGRSANVNDVECAAELSTVTRWQIGGSGASDAHVPPKPFFGLEAPPRGGTVELNGISFGDLKDTKSISSATLSLYYWDELQGAPGVALLDGIGTEDQVMDLNIAAAADEGTFVQIGREVMRLDKVENSSTRYEVTRGVHGTTAEAHDAQALVYRLARKTVIAPFPAGFFGSPYSGSWSYPVPMADVRIASAELYVSNVHGDSETASIRLTHNNDYGLRTLSGGQYCIQVEGYLAVDQSAAPALVVESSHAVRDVYAVLGKGADAPVELQLQVDGTDYCLLTFATGMIVSNSVEGVALPPLTAGTKLTLAVTKVGVIYPGADLTVLIRL